MFGFFSRSSALVVLMLCASAGFAQNSPRSMSGVVHGQVRYAAGGAPAQDVMVRLESFQGGIVGQLMTDRTGKFRFTGLQPNLYVVVVHWPGFRDASQQVDLQTTTSGYVLLQLVSDEPHQGAAGSGPAAARIDANVPQEARREFEKGQSDLHERKNLEGGLRHLEKAVSLHPDYLEAHLLLGTAYMDAQQWDKAERALLRTLEIKPDTPPALFALGEVYRIRGRLAEAEKALLGGLKLEEKSVEGRYALARTYWAMGDVVKAAPEAIRLRDLKPDFAPGHLLLGNIYLRSRDPQHALAEFEHYLKLDPNGAYAEQTKALVEKIRKALGSSG